MRISNNDKWFTGKHCDLNTLKLGSNLNWFNKINSVRNVVIDMLRWEKCNFLQIENLWKIIFSTVSIDWELHVLVFEFPRTLFTDRS